MAVALTVSGCCADCPCCVTNRNDVVLTLSGCCDCSQEQVDSMGPAGSVLFVVVVTLFEASGRPVMSAGKMTRSTCTIHGGNDKHQSADSASSHPQGR